MLLNSPFGELQNLTDFPRRLSLRRPGEHFALTLCERRHFLGFGYDQLTHPLKSIERHEVEAGLDLWREVELVAYHPDASFKPIGTMDRHDKAPFEAKVRKEPHNLPNTVFLALLAFTGRQTPFKRPC